MCGKHICEKHTIYDNRDFGDYPDRYCKSCWNIGKIYREKMDNIEMKADMLQDRLANKWKIEALKAKKVIK